MYWGSKVKYTFQLFFPTLCVLNCPEWNLFTFQLFLRSDLPTSISVNHRHCQVIRWTHTLKSYPVCNVLQWRGFKNLKFFLGFRQIPKFGVGGHTKWFHHFIICAKYYNSDHMQFLVVFKRINLNLKLMLRLRCTVFICFGYMLIHTCSKFTAPISKHNLNWNL